MLGPTSLAVSISDQPVVSEADDLNSSGGGLEKAMEGLGLDGSKKATEAATAAAKDKKQQTLADLAASSSASSTSKNTFNATRQGRSDE